MKKLLTHTPLCERGIRHPSPRAVLGQPKVQGATPPAYGGVLPTTIPPTPPEAEWAITSPTQRGFGPPVPKSCLEVGGYQPGGVRAGEEAPPRKLDQERGQAAGRALRGLERGDGALHEGRSRATEWTFRAALEGQWQQHSGPWI